MLHVPFHYSVDRSVCFVNTCPLHNNYLLMYVVDDIIQLVNDWVVVFFLW